MICVLPWLLQDAIRRFLYTSERLSAASLNSAISYLLQVGGIGVLFFADVAASLLLVFLILSGSSLLASLVGVVQLRSEIFSNWEAGFDFKSHMNRLWTFGKWLSTGELVGWLGQNGNTWIIGVFLGARIVAGYRCP